jgi:hypothetical protein
MPFPFNRSLAGDSLTMVPGETSSISPTDSRALSGVFGRSASSPIQRKSLTLPGVPGSSVARLGRSLLGLLPGESLLGLLKVDTSPEDLRQLASRWCLERDCRMREY